MADLVGTKGNCSFKQLVLCSVYVMCFMSQFNVNTRWLQLCDGGEMHNVVTLQEKHNPKVMEERSTNNYLWAKQIWIQTEWANVERKKKKHYIFSLSLKEMPRLCRLCLGIFVHYWISAWIWICFITTAIKTWLHRAHHPGDEIKYIKILPLYLLY